ncbi:hypothetical protein DFQ26_002392 [Actinomortierella ambigua]|nr:hypothetical protein DFQ26_002392 [Actinomortierella ambigua]
MSLVSSSPSSAPINPSHSIVLASPDRVVFKTIPHPLSSANKRVTLSYRRPAPASAPLPPPSPQDLYPNSCYRNNTTSASASATTTAATVHQQQQQSNSDTEDNAALLPRNSPSPNSAHSHPHHRRSMSGPLNSKELMDIAAARHNNNGPRMQVNTKQINVGHGGTTGGISAASMTTPTTPTPTATIPPSSPAVVRYHKNGLPIKSAMKSSRSLSITTDGSNNSSSNNSNDSNGLARPSLCCRSVSSPGALSSPKYVHFNTQLEHVRLFLQGETPSSVAGRETLIDPRQHEAATSNIVLTLPNWSPLANVASFQPGQADAPLRCESVQLNEEKTKLCGKILVQNIAFHKHVSVRYTVDFWRNQTEIGAEYEASITGTALDRFKFEIPLEMEKQCVEKTFCMAIRYQVNGREFWDSNHDLNYQIECKREIVVPSVSEILAKKMGGLMLGGSGGNNNNNNSSSNSNNIGSGGAASAYQLPEYHKPVLRKKSSGSRYDLSSSLSATLSSYGRSNTVGNNNINNNSNGHHHYYNTTSLTKTTTPAVVTPTMGSQSPYRASEYISAPIQSPPDFHRQLYASSPKFVIPYLGSASPPEHFRIGFEPVAHGNGNKKGSSPSSPMLSWGFEVESPAPPPMVTRGHSFPPAAGGGGSSPMSMAKSAPISIPKPPASGRPAVGSAGYYDLVDRYCFYESSPHSSPYSTYSNSPPAPCIRG